MPRPAVALRALPGFTNQFASRGDPHDSVWRGAIDTEHDHD
jgi:hypothetical protein